MESRQLGNVDGYELHGEKNSLHREAAQKEAKMAGSIFRTRGRLVLHVGGGIYMTSGDSESQRVSSLKRLGNRLTTTISVFSFICATLPVRVIVTGYLRLEVSGTSFTNDNYSVNTAF
jgi:hypothetical protein